MGVGWHEKHQSRIGLWYKDMRNREVGDGRYLIQYLASPRFIDLRLIVARW